MTDRSQKRFLALLETYQKIVLNVASIYCWDPDGPADPRGFARADHCDHIHWGMDA